MSRAGRSHCGSPPVRQSHPAQGTAARATQFSLARGVVGRHPLWHAHDPEEARIERRGGAGPGARNRHEHRGFQLCQRASAAAPRGCAGNGEPAGDLAAQSNLDRRAELLPFTYPDYTYYRDHSRALEGVLAFDGDGSQAIWNRSGEGQVIQGQLVSGNFFSLLGVNAALGRVISSADDQLGNPRPVVVLSHSFWQRQLGADPAIVGKTLVLNGAAFTVIGVAPAGFAGMLVATQPDFWAPVTIQARFTHDRPARQSPQ